MSEERRDRMNVIKKFFLFCAAADTEVLRQCPGSEQQKYASIGATVFFTGMLACLSGGYALYTVFESLWMSVFLGLLWGVLVFNLDRFLVSTMKKTRERTREIVQILPRFLLAILLAVVISTPLELKIFEEEINEQIFYEGARKMDHLDSTFQQRTAIKRQRIDLIKADIDKQREARDDFYRQYVCECDGTCGTGQKGRGSECERKRDKYEQSADEFLKLKAASDEEIAAVQQEIENLQEQNKVQRASLERSFADGLMVRLNALRKLPSGPQWAILLLLIAIEIAPILVKLLSPYGPYDHLLKTIEYNFEIDEVVAINQRNQELNNKLTVMAGVEHRKVEQELKNNEGAMKLIGEAHLELVKEQLKIWTEKEKERIRSEAKKHLTDSDQKL